MALLEVIKKNNVPKVILRYIMMNFLDFNSIKTIMLTVGEMNVLDTYSKIFLEKAENGFKWNCKNGHLDVAEWLYYNNNIIDNHDDDDMKNLFCNCCENGQLAISKWLYSIIHINIHQRDKERAFRWSCGNGQLDVAKWLYSLGQVDIHAEYECAFTMASTAGHLDVAKWLHSLGGVNINALYGYAFRYARKNVLQWLHSIENNVQIGEE